MLLRISWCVAGLFLLFPFMASPYDYSCSSNARSLKNAAEEYESAHSAFESAKSSYDSAKSAYETHATGVGVTQGVRKVLVVHTVTKEAL